MPVASSPVRISPRMLTVPRRECLSTPSAVGYSFQSIYFDDPTVTGRILDVFAPAEIRSDVGLFFVHGGGWRAGSRTIFHSIMRAFNAHGFLCGSTDYRLAQVGIRDQLQDVRHGYRLFQQHCAAQTGKRRTFVIGSSAGAHLAALLGLAKPGACGEPSANGTAEVEAPIGMALQACPVMFEPWEEIFPGIWASMQDIVGVSYERAPERYRQVSPIEHLSSTSPPVFLLEAENEHMFPLQNAQRFVEKAQSLGCRALCKVYGRAEHGFFYDVVRPVQRQAFEDILAFITHSD